MAGEITIGSTLNVRKADTTTQIVFVSFSSQNSFQATLTGNSGPYSGTLLAKVTLTTVDLSIVGTGGVYQVSNQSPTYSVILGLKNTVRNKFQPLHTLLPGETYVGRLSDFIGAEQTIGTGTGTAGSGGTELAFKGIGATVPVLLEIFPK